MRKLEWWYISSFVFSIQVKLNTSINGIDFSLEIHYCRIKISRSWTCLCTALNQRRPGIAMLTMVSMFVIEYWFSLENIREFLIRLEYFIKELKSTAHELPLCSVLNQWRPQYLGTMLTMVCIFVNVQIPFE